MEKATANVRTFLNDLTILLRTTLSMKTKTNNVTIRMRLELNSRSVTGHVRPSSARAPTSKKSREKTSIINKPRRPSSAAPTRPFRGGKGTKYVSPHIRALYGEKPSLIRNPTLSKSNLPPSCTSMEPESMLHTITQLKETLKVEYEIRMKTTARVRRLEGVIKTRERRVEHLLRTSATTLERTPSATTTSLQARISQQNNCISELEQTVSELRSIIKDPNRLEVEKERDAFYTEMVRVQKSMRLQKQHALGQEREKTVLSNRLQAVQKHVLNLERDKIELKEELDRPTPRRTRPVSASAVRRKVQQPKSILKRKEDKKGVRGQSVETASTSKLRKKKMIGRGEAPSIESNENIHQTMSSTSQETSTPEKTVNTKKQGAGNANSSDTAPKREAKRQEKTTVFKAHVNLDDVRALASTFAEPILDQVRRKIEKDQDVDLYEDSYFENEDVLESEATTDVLSTNDLNSQITFKNFLK